MQNEVGSKVEEAAPVQPSGPEAGGAVGRLSSRQVHTLNVHLGSVGTGAAHGNGEGLVVRCRSNLILVPSCTELEVVVAIVVSGHLVDGLLLAPSYLLVPLGVMRPLRKGKDLVPKTHGAARQDDDQDLVHGLALPLEFAGVDEHVVGVETMRKGWFVWRRGGLREKFVGGDRGELVRTSRAA